MHTITLSCVLFLWLYMLACVKSQDCTLEEFVNGPKFDSNFDTSDLEARYAGGKQVRVGCNVGYSGFFKLLCIEGKWQSKGTVCQPRSCGHPGDSQFADFHLEKGDDFVFGSQIVYTCHKGYQMVSRNNYRRCMAEGWDGVVPVCEAQQCPVIHVDSNVLVIGDPEDAIYGNVIRFSCKYNSQILIGLTELYCDENGVWSGEVPKCEEIKCSVPEIANGHVLGDIEEYKENDVLHFTCNPKYKHTEDRPSKCIKQRIRAEWIPAPACELITCRLLLPPLEGTRFEPPFKSTFSPGDSVRVICGERYTIAKTQEAETTCKENGEWTIPPECQEITCSNRRPNEVHYWNVRWGDRITMGYTTNYWCRTGYKRTDGATRATCTRDGWNPYPLCQVITCNSKYFENAETVRQDQHVYRYNAQVEYICKPGYHGRFTLTCGETGWSGNSECIKRRCQKLQIDNAHIIHNEKYTYGYNEQVQYACNYVERVFTVTCGQSGWTGIHTCSERQCQKLQLNNAQITHNEKDTYSHNERVQYTCRNDAEIVFTVTCGQNGWTGIQTCSERQCAKFQIDNAQITANEKNTYSHNEQVQYTCRNDAERVFTVTCGQSGWTGIETCSERQCQKFQIDNAHITHNEKDTYSHNERVQYTCNHAERVFTLTCGQRGWTGIQRCSACPNAHVPHGLIFGPYNDTLYYTCKKGYKLFTKGWWAKAICEDGLWTGLEKCIENTTCGDIPEIPHGEVTPPRGKSASARIVCDEGYHAQVNRLTCQEGKWLSDGLSPQTICTPTRVPCNPPPKVDNAVVEHSYQKEYLSDSAVTYQCRDKYTTMEGEDTILCKDGKWEEKNITCTAYCDKLEDETVTFTADKERYMDGEVIEYRCVTPGVEGNATCINTKWNKSDECKAASDADFIRGPKKSQ